jgi:Type I phosphodiesterase / nucleotide pyrophosphatase
MIRRAPPFLATALLVTLPGVALLGAVACTSRPTAMPTARGGHPVIFVGLDGADWDLLDGYIDAGVMPNLAALVREGRAGTLTTIQPPLSPLVWTTMMTGAGPLEHGILDFTRFHPVTREREPITSDDRLRPLRIFPEVAGGPRGGHPPATRWTCTWVTRCRQGATHSIFSWTSSIS